MPEHRDSRVPHPFHGIFVERVGYLEPPSRHMPFARKSGKPREPLNEAGLYEYAVRSLGQQMRTEADMRRLMQRRVEPGEPGEAAISAVLARLHEYGYLNDVAFAET